MIRKEIINTEICDTTISFCYHKVQCLSSLMCGTSCMLHTVGLLKVLSCVIVAIIEMNIQVPHTATGY